MATAEKIQAVEELTQSLGEAKGVYLTDFSGLTVAQIMDLRRKCKKEQIEYKVVKRTLLQRAAQNVGLDALQSDLSGPCGLALSRVDELVPARVLSDFAKTNEKFRIRLAVIDGKAVAEQDVKSLATLPEKPVLQAMLLGALNGPAASLAGVLQAPLGALLSVLSQRGEEKGESPATVEGDGTAAAAETETGAEATT
jgi:large subunit ribosomal protein L10